MKKKINNQFLSKSFGFLTISLILVLAIYGGLSINKLQKQNQSLVTKQATLEYKIGTMSNDLIDSQNKLAQVSSDLDQTKTDLVKNKSQLAYYQQQVDLMKNNSSLIVQPALAVNPIVKTVTKKTTQVVYKDKIPNQALVNIDGIGKYKVDLKSSDNGWTVLQRAAAKNNFKIDFVNDPSWGIELQGFNGIDHWNDGKYWAYFHNGIFSQVGIADSDAQNQVAPGDTVSFVIQSY